MSNVAHEKRAFDPHLIGTWKKKTREWDRCVILWREENQEEQLSRREMEDESVAEEVEESVVTLDVQSPLCLMSF